MMNFEAVSPAAVYVLLRAPVAFTTPPIVTLQNRLINLGRYGAIVHRQLFIANEHILVVTEVGSPRSARRDPPAVADTQVSQPFSCTFSLPDILQLFMR